MYILVLRRYKAVLNGTHLSPGHALSWWRLHPRLVLSMARITLSSIPYYRLFIDYLGWHSLRTAPVKGQIMQADWNDLTAKGAQTNTSCLFMHLGSLGGRAKTRKVLSEECLTRAREKGLWMEVSRQANTTMHQLVCSQGPPGPSSPFRNCRALHVPCLVWGRAASPRRPARHSLRSALKKITHRVWTGTRILTQFKNWNITDTFVSTHVLLPIQLSLSSRINYYSEFCIYKFPWFSLYRFITNVCILKMYSFSKHFPGCPVVKTQCLPLQGPWIPSLIRGAKILNAKRKGPASLQNLQ